MNDKPETGVVPIPCQRCGGQSAFEQDPPDGRDLIIWRLKCQTASCGVSVAGEYWGGSADSELANMQKRVTIKWNSIARMYLEGDGSSPDICCSCSNFNDCSVYHGPFLGIAKCNGFADSKPAPCEPSVKLEDLKPEVRENYLWIRFRDELLKPVGHMEGCTECEQTYPEIKELCHGDDMTSLCSVFRLFGEWKTRQYKQEGKI